MKKYFEHTAFFLLVFFLTRLVTSCANMGQPDGGWYDEKPPYVVGAEPAENDTCVTKKKIKIMFNEFVKIDNATEKVLVSPPQHEMPEIKATGKNIYVELQDSLIPNTTYTIDFSDAISDNNEGNPMGNYAYTFSTGNHIDTLEVSGYVLESENLEPIKGILVGLYPKDTAMVEADTLKPFTRISRSDSRGKFVIKGIAPGQYIIGALQDQDNDYKFSQKSEKMAFSHDIIVPTCGPDTRQDTIWKDRNHIKDIKVTPYTHFRPDNIVLRAFTHKTSDRYYIKAERTEANHFILYFSATTPDKALPKLRLLNDSRSKSQVPGAKPVGSPFLIERSHSSLGEDLGADTITYWIKDMALVDQDTLKIEMKTLVTDTIGKLQPVTDTLEILAKTPYAKRLKTQQDKIKSWQKEIAKKLKRAQPGEVIDTIMPKETLQVRYSRPSVMSPNGAVVIEVPTPLERFDTAAVHLYVEQDSLWYRAPLTIEQEHTDSTKILDPAHHTVSNRRIVVFTDWIPGANYSFEVDSLAFTDIYGVSSGKYKAGIQVAKLEDYGSLFVNVTGLPVASSSQKKRKGWTEQPIVQMLDGSDKVLMSAPAKDGTAEFYYIQPGEYYLRCFIDRNGNGIWDTGDYYKDQQPEEVYYFSESVECKAKWDLTKNWNLTARPLYQQKPGAITKQKPEAEKTIKMRNIQRAQQKGIPLPAYLQ